MIAPDIQAASVRRTAIAFGLPYRHLLNAVRNSELHAYSSGRGIGRGVLLWDEVRAWLKDMPVKPRKPRRKS